jgi:hypothetical protein
VRPTMKRRLTCNRDDRSLAHRKADVPKKAAAAAPPAPFPNVQDRPSACDYLRTENLIAASMICRVTASSAFVRGE